MMGSISSASSASKAIYLRPMSEPRSKSYSGVYLGKSAIYKTPVFMDSDELSNPHMAIIGTSGAGKTYLIKSLVAKRVLYEGYSLAVLDWNGEYSDLIHFLGGAVLVLGGNSTINLFHILWQSDKRSMGNAIEVIKSAARLDGEEEELLGSLVSELITTVGFGQLSIKLIIDRLGSSSGNLSKGLSIKLSHLLDNPIFAESTSFDPLSILSGVTSIDLSLLKSDTQRDCVSQSVLYLITNLMHSMELNTNARKMLVIDEAWRMFPNRAEVGALFREGRKYGLGIVVASQMAEDLNNEILANCSVIFIFRLHSGADYDILLTMGVIGEEERQKMPTLSVGSCLAIIGTKEQGNRPNRFFMEKVEGIDLRAFMVSGVNMNVQISRKRFFELTAEHLKGGEVAQKAYKLVEENEGKIDASSLIGALLDSGLKRSNIIPYLKEIGIPDIDIVLSFEAAKNLYLEVSVSDA